MNDQRPVILLGAGGHAKMLLEILQQHNVDIQGFVSPTEKEEPPFDQLKWLGQDEFVLANKKSDVYLVNAIGSIGETQRRAKLFRFFHSRGYEFMHVIHPGARLSTNEIKLGAGLQLMPASVVNTSCQLGDNVLINTGAIVEHDCRIGDHTHVASGAILCGGCTLGDGVHIGSGATVIQGINIGDGAVIAAGAVVIRDVEPFSMVAGVPASFKKQLG